MDKIRVGFCMCGSFCTFSEVIPQIKNLVDLGYKVTPIMSEISYVTDTRFGKAKDFQNQLEAICGNDIIHAIHQAEPIGPKKMFDILIVAPCTGNTLAKLANGISDTSVTLGVKAHLRNNRPVVIAISTNDALGGSAKNIGQLLNYKHIYFVPFSQDDPIEKNNSIVADFTKIINCMELALENKQIQPILL